MTMRQFWCIYDAKIGEPKYGSMRESEVERLYQALTDAQEAEKRGEKWQPQLYS